MHYGGTVEVLYANTVTNSQCYLHPSLCLALSVLTRHYNKGLASRLLKIVGNLLRTNESNTCGSTCIQRSYSCLWNKVYGPYLRFLCSTFRDFEFIHIFIYFGLCFMIGCVLLNHRLFQKFKSIENNIFNHLVNTLTFSFTCGLKLLLNKWGSTRGIFNNMIKKLWSQGSNSRPLFWYHVVFISNSILLESVEIPC
jgi:hypothetical protein